MKKLVNIGLILLLIIALSYIAFLTILPTYLQSKINNPAIKQTINEATQLKVDYRGLKIYTTNTLNIGFKANELSATYSDDQPFAKIAKVDIQIASIPLLFKTIDIKAMKGHLAAIDLITLETRRSKITDYMNSFLKPEYVSNKFPQVKGYTVKLSSIKFEKFKLVTTQVVTGQYQILEEEKYVIPKATVLEYLKPYFEPKDGNVSFNLK